MGNNGEDGPKSSNTGELGASPEDVKKIEEKLTSKFQEIFNQFEKELSEVLDFLTENGLSSEDVKKIGEELTSKFQGISDKFKEFKEKMIKTLAFLTKYGYSSEKVEEIVKKLISNFQRKYGMNEENVEYGDNAQLDKSQKLQGRENDNGGANSVDKIAKIQKELKEKYVKIEENVEEGHYKGKMVEICLPEMGDNPFKYFVSYESYGFINIREGDLNISFSKDEIIEFLKQLIKYFNINGIEVTWDADKEEVLDEKLVKVLIDNLGLKYGNYLLNDRTVFYIGEGCCGFSNEIVSISDNEHLFFNVSKLSTRGKIGN